MKRNRKLSSLTTAGDSASLYEALFEQSVDGILIVSEGRIIRANPALCELLGYEPEELIDRDPINLLLPANRETAKRRIAVLLDGTPLTQTYVYQALHRAGHVVHLETTSRLVRWNDHIVIQTIARDVTEELQAEAALHESEQRYRSLFDCIPIGLYRTTSTGTIVNVNSTLVKMLDYPDRETLLATHARSVYADVRSRERVRDRIEQDGVVEDFEAIWRRYDGTPMWVEENVRAVQAADGSELFYEGSAKDISRRKAAEQALEREKAYFEQLFESAPEAVVLCTIDSRIVRTNREFERLFGYSAQEANGRNIDDLIAPIENGLRKEAASITQQVARGEIAAVESIRRRKDGSLVHVSILGTPILVDEEQAGVYGIYRDITDRKAAEHALSEAHLKVKKLHETAGQLERATTEDEAFRITVDAAERILGYSHCVLDVAEDESLVRRAASSETPAGRPRRTRIEDAGIAVDVHETQRTSTFHEALAPAQAEAGPPRIRALITAPIPRVGVFQAASQEPNASSQQDVQFLETLLGHTAAAVARLRLEAELKDQATHDALTGVYNRRHFNEVIERETLRATRYQHPLGLLMIDVNRFKEINDRFGHQAGDAVLHGIAALLRQTVRETDLIVRYGGDEFLVVLTETGDEAQQAAERIRSAVRRDRALQELVGFTVSVSVGAISWRPNSNLPVEQALARADARLYEEKRRS